MLHTQLQHLPHDTFKFYLKRRDKFFRDATTQASPSMLKHLSSIMTIVGREIRVRERAFLPTTRSMPTSTALVASDGKARCCYC